ncbi:MAG: cupin domain-containing protein [Actinomycetota bacterium]|nr:cupin domain-containing protein [Actinomycetota bacterium]
MSHSSREDAPDVETMPGFDGRYADLEGFTVGFEVYDEDADNAPLLAGLPGDSCPCRHWGYVLSGRAVYSYADGDDEVYQAGDAYVARPGHSAFLEAGTELVEFTPTDAHNATMAVVNRNLAALAE